MVYQLGADPSRIDILSESEFRLFADLIRKECGFSFGIEKRAFLESRLKRRMGDLGVKSASEYYGLIKSSTTGSRELPALLDALMVCETSFFRNLPQFVLFRDYVLPEVIAQKMRNGSRMLRLWSAGCATGQEPYSIVISLMEALSDAGSWTSRVFASDLSFTALERAQSAVYSLGQLKGVDGAHIKKYFYEKEGLYIVNDEVKKRVVFDYHNLKHDNGLRGLDIIFCRNVMIYFNADEQRRLVERFASCLVPGGYLFLGHAESLQGISGRFSMVHRNKGIAYRLDG